MNEEKRIKNRREKSGEIFFGKKAVGNKDEKKGGKKRWEEKKEIRKSYKN